MDVGTQGAIRTQLVDRRHRLRSAISEIGEATDLVTLLRAVDAALERMDDGAFGRCDVCGEHVEDDVLLTTPATTYCLCALSPQQQSLLQTDLDLASRIQWSLLPKQDLAAAGWETHFRYEPAGAVSGDFCDLVAREGDEDGGDLHFLVGDVSGKGFAASYVMAHLSAVFHGFIDARLPVGEQVERANRLLLENKISSHYATMVCGRAGRDGAVELCNAGHCPPLLLRAGGVEEVKASGLPIGLFGGRSYTVSRVDLRPSEALVLYTDGVTETRDPAGEEFGIDRLRSLLREIHALPARRMAAACIDSLARFRAGAPRADDLTVVVLVRSA